MLQRPVSTLKQRVFCTLSLAVASIFAANAVLEHAAFAQAGTTRPNSGTGTTGGSSGGGGKGIGVGIGTIIGVGKLISDAAKKDKTKKRKTAPKRTHKRKPPKKKSKSAKRPRTPLPAATRERVPNEIVLSFASDTPRSVIDAVLQTYGLRQEEEALIPLTDKRIIRAIGADNLSQGRRRQLQADPRVTVSDNSIYTLSASAPKQYAVSKLQLRDIHKSIRGDGTLVAVIDSGARLSHPAIAAAIIEQQDVLPKKSKIMDSHGTAVASIIAAQQGMLSVAPGSRILSVRAFAPATKKRPAEGTVFDIIKALNAAFQGGAQIINMSFAGPSNHHLKEAVEKTYELGIVMVGAAGNDGRKAKPAYPAAYLQVIAVTATDKKDRLYKKANRGDHIAFAAPGVNVIVAKNKKSYGTMSGTSMATAFVTGAIALLLEKEPSLTADQIVNVLALSSDDLGKKGRDTKFGHGLINPHTALTQTALPAVASETPDGNEVAVGLNR